MAWNEPNSRDPKNPWNRGKKNQGPPDLEEIARKIRDKFVTLMGGKKPGLHQPNSNNNGNKKTGLLNFKNFTLYHFALILGALLGLWILSGIYIVSPMKRGVVLRFGQYHHTVEPGPHWLPRLIDSYKTVNVQEATSFTYNDEMLTRDGNIVSVELSVIYRRDNVRNYLFNVKDPQESIKQATASALRQVIGDSDLDEILTTGRQKIRDDVLHQLIAILKPYKTGIEVIDVNLQPAKPPEAVTEAFDDVIKARKDEKRFVNEAEAYASQYNATVVGEVERILREAEAEKERLTADAHAEVAQFKALRQLYRAQPEVMKTRLYMDAIESILSKSSKVLVATKSGQNILYLPLDKIVESQRQNNREDNNQVEGVSAPNDVDPDLPADTAATQLTEANNDRRSTLTRGGYQWQQ